MGDGRMDRELAGKASFLALQILHKIDQQDRIGYDQAVSAFS